MARIRKFGRKSNLRKALIKGLALSLIKKGRIKTTEAKAKSLRPFIERLITVGKKQNLPARRFLLSELFNNKEAVQKILKDYAPKYANRPGGYTRILKIQERKSDAARQSLIEFV